MSEKLSLGGRSFRPAGIGPVRHDLYLMMHARHAGLTDAELADGESPEDFAARLLDQMIRSGRALLIMGALLIPDGKSVDDWTEEMAVETASTLGSVSDPEEKKVLYSQLLSALMGFFQNGLGSWAASRRSSGAGPATTTSGPRARSGSERPTDTASGADSSGPSPSTTPPAAAPS